MTLWDSPAGKAAIRAGAKNAPRCVACDSNAPCQRCLGEAQGIIEAALPHIRRALAEELRAEADNYVADERSGFWAAADFLIRREDR